MRWLVQFVQHISTVHFSGSASTETLFNRTERDRLGVGITPQRGSFRNLQKFTLPLQETTPLGIQFMQLDLLKCECLCGTIRLLTLQREKITVVSITLIAVSAHRGSRRKGAESRPSQSYWLSQAEEGCCTATALLRNSRSDAEIDTYVCSSHHSSRPYRPQRTKQRCSKLFQGL